MVRVYRVMFMVLHFFCFCLSRHLEIYILFIYSLINYLEIYIKKNASDTTTYIPEKLILSSRTLNE